MNEQNRDRDFFPGFVFALILTVANVYFYSFIFFKNLGLSHQSVNNLFLALYDAGLFGSVKGFSYLITKGVAMLLLVMTFIVRNGVSQDVTWKECIVTTSIGLVFFIIPPLIGDIGYVVTSSVGFVVLVIGIKKLASKFTSFKKRVNDPYETFEQNEILIDTPLSLNLKMRYYWKGKWRNGWVNCIEQRRHMFVCGIPGSGKSFSIIEEQIIQNIEKGYSMFIYDFKYPDLSSLAYNVWMKNRKVYKDKYGYDDNFLVVNFKDPRYSDRCNPLDPKYIRQLADAQEAAACIMNDLIPNREQSSDKFFGPSAEVWLAGLISILRDYDHGRYCTFPHLIELVSYDYKQILEYAKKDNRLKKLFSAFIDADNPKSQGQIQGQIASARIPLMKMMDPYLYWVMSANDVPLDLNNGKAPKIMCIGNVPNKIKITSTAISLIASRMFKEVNMEKGAPLNINIDECTTFHATGMDSTMATCRSKDIGFTIAVQDPYQMFRDWGEKEAKAIIGNLGSQFFGQSLGEYNRHVSDLIGKEFREHQSLSSGDSDSVSTSFQLEERASVAALANLSQGEFIGWAADNVDHPNTLKQFHCFIETDLDKRNSLKRYTPGIPKNRKMTPFFKDKEIENGVRQDPDGALMQYFIDELNKLEEDKRSRLKDYHVLAPEVLEEAAREQFNAVRGQEREKLLNQIIEDRQIKGMEEVLAYNEEVIRSQIPEIFASKGIIAKKEQSVFGGGSLGTYDPATT